MAAYSRWPGAAAVAAAVVVVAAAVAAVLAVAVVAPAAGPAVHRGASAASAKACGAFRLHNDKHRVLLAGIDHRPGQFLRNDAFSFSALYSFSRLCGPAGECRPYFLPIQKLLERIMDRLPGRSLSPCAALLSRQPRVLTR